MRLKLFEEFTTGKRSVSSGVVSWEELRKIVPNSVYLKAKKMYTNVEGNTNLVGDSEVIQGWWIETHTLGCRNAADEAEENWIDSHWKIYDEYSKDDMSYVVPAEDLIFVTLTPQRKNDKENLVEGLISTSPVKKTIYHFSESLDSLSDILSDDVLRSGEKTNYGRGYENISFTWNPNLWDIEYAGDYDYRYKVKMCFDYNRMSKEWKFEPYDYFSSEKEMEQDPEEQEERVVTDEMNGIIKYITKVYISSEYGRGDMEWLKNEYPTIKFVWSRRKVFKKDRDSEMW